MSWFVLYVSLGYAIRVAMVPVILRRQFAPGASLAWLGVIFLHPYIGTALYMMLSETRIGPQRIARHRELVQYYRAATELTDQPQCAIDPAVADSYAPMILQAQKISGLPVLEGNAVEFLPTCEQFIDRLVADMDAAVSEIHLLYYMFDRDKTAQRVATALIAAVKRGVHCRVLADAVASRGFFRTTGLGPGLRDAGVEVVAAMKVAMLRQGLPRVDLRNHRKLAVIDGKIAYAGSHNLINPDYGGRQGNPWIDVTGRLTGPITHQLGLVFAEDWAFETGVKLDAPEFGPHTGTISMQVVPTGPIAVGETYRRLLLGAIQSARSRIVLTTPYFVPDEPTLVALLMAADRGVQVQLIVPQVADHFFTAAAGRAHYSKLLEGGVSIHLYRPGLLHSKTVTVDDAVGLFGSANLDVRSFNLNFELSVLLYGKEATEQLRAVQSSYLADSTPLNFADWSRPNLIRQYFDRAVSLLSPLL